MILNKGKGWVRYSYTGTDLTAAEKLICSTIYNREVWGKVETAEGVFDWSVLDNIKNAAVAIGKKFAFGVMAAHATYGVKQVVPQYVWDAGALYTIISTASGTGMSLELSDCETAWDEQVVEGVTQGTGAKATNESTGSYSTQITTVGVGANTILASKAITAKNLSTRTGYTGAYNMLRLWIKSSINTSAGDLQILLDSHANCASPSETLDVPALVAGVWQEVVIELVNAATDTAIISVGIKQVADLADCVINIDRVAARYGQKVPVWNDSIYLAKLAVFVAALATKYDGDDDIEFIDIRSYGNWGEEHTGGLEQNGVTYTYANHYTAAKDLTNAELITHHNIWVNAFSQTRLIMPWGVAACDNAYGDDGVSGVHQGLGIRRDAIMQWKSASAAGECTRAHGYAPSVFEFYSSYAGLKTSNYWDADILRDSVELGKPSYIGLGQWATDGELFRSENVALIDELADRMGYYFSLTDHTFPATIANDTNLVINLTFANEGVTYIYEDCYVALALLDVSDAVVSKVWLDEIVPSSWAPDSVNEQSTSFKFAGVPEATYTLAVGLYKSKTDTNPTYRIDHANETDELWYELGSVTLSAASTLNPMMTNRLKMLLHKKYL